MNKKRSTRETQGAVCLWFFYFGGLLLLGFSHLLLFAALTLLDFLLPGPLLLLLLLQLAQALLVLALLLLSLLLLLTLALLTL